MSATTSPADFDGAECSSWCKDANWLHPRTIYQDIAATSVATKEFQPRTEPATPSLSLHLDLRHVRVEAVGSFPDIKGRLGLPFKRTAFSTWLQIVRMTFVRPRNSKPLG